MRNRVYASVGRQPVRPSVNLSVSHTRPQHAAAAGLLLWARRAKDIDRLLHSWRAAGECGQCHIVCVRSS